MKNNSNPRKINFSALIHSIKTSYSLEDYCNRELGMNIRSGERGPATYRGGNNPSCFELFDDTYSDWGFPGGPRVHCDIIQLCADAHHNGDRTAAIYELARGNITYEDDEFIKKEPLTWGQWQKNLSQKISSWHQALRKEDRDYLHSRHISDQTIDRLQIGYSDFLKRIIFPYYRSGKVVYYAGRDVTGRWKEKLCAKYTKMSISHFFVENVPFGLHTLEPDHEKFFTTITEKFKLDYNSGRYYAETSNGEKIFRDDYLCILEGVLDALSFEQEGYKILSPCGGFFGQSQIKTVLDAARGIGRVCLCFDNDEAGTSFQLKLGQLLFENNIKFVSARVPKRIQGAHQLHVGISMAQIASNKILVDTDLSSLEFYPGRKIMSGDVLSFDGENFYEIANIIDNRTIELKEKNQGLQNGLPFTATCSITQGIKDVNDYYSQGGNLADLIANAEDGIYSLARILRSDLDVFKKFLKECARKVEQDVLEDLLNLIPDEKISKRKKFLLLKEILRAPSEQDIARRMLGYRDENGKIHKAKYKIKYLLNNGFFEYVNGVWERREDFQIQEYIYKELGGFGNQRRVQSTLHTLKVFAQVKYADERHANYFNMLPLMNFSNGILDLSRPDESIRKLLPHDEKYLSTLQVKYMYDAEAKCPEWEKFLTEVLEGDKEKIMLLQEYAGYVLFNSNPIHKMLFLMGDGRNGKGTVIDVLRAVFGENCVTNVNPAKFNQEFQAILLNGSYVNFCSDAEKDFRPSQEIIKQVVAGEPIMGCFKFQKHVSFRPRAKLITACNNLVEVADTSRGFLSRCLLIYFNKCYEGREDFNLLPRLKKELAGIFNWVLDGYIRLRARLMSNKPGEAFTRTREQLDAMRDLEKNTSPVFLFYEEMKDKNIYTNGEAHKTFEAPMSTAEMHKTYCEWAAGAKYPMMSRNSFTMEFKKVLRQKRPDMINGRNIRMKKNDAGDECYDFSPNKIGEAITRETDNSEGTEQVTVIEQNFPLNLSPSNSEQKQENPANSQSSTEIKSEIKAEIKPEILQEYACFEDEVKARSFILNGFLSRLKPGYQCQQQELEHIECGVRYILTLNPNDHQSNDPAAEALEQTYWRALMKKEHNDLLMGVKYILYYCGHYDAYKSEKAQKLSLPASEKENHDDATEINFDEDFQKELRIKKVIELIDGGLKSPYIHYDEQIAFDFWQAIYNYVHKVNFTMTPYETVKIAVENVWSLCPFDGHKWLTRKTPDPKYVHFEFQYDASSMKLDE